VLGKEHFDGERLVDACGFDRGVAATDEDVRSVARLAIDSIEG
jgi:hypothetical protein